ncbi:MAG: Rsd/AlgQ family anti-sigma factor [Chromatiales bacterium]
MAQKNGTSPRRRKGSRRLVDKMLTERQHMLVLMCEVLGLKPFTGDKPVRELLAEFNSVLVDYIAAGHFGLYQRIVEGTERRRAVIIKASKVYPKIAESTDAAVDFNDKYGGEWNFHLLDTLAGDLSALGEKLATRIELEDQVIAAMLGENATQQHVLAPGAHAR